MTTSLKDILTSIDNALVTVKGIADIPGVNLIPYVSTLSSVISTIHAAYVAEQNIEPYIAEINATFAAGKVPTESDMAALDAKIAALEAKVDAPLPDPEPGEPD